MVDQRTGMQQGKHASPSALGNLWRGIISPFWQLARTKSRITCSVDAD